MKKIWFKRKRYGWGWTPSTIEGWGVVLIYVVALILLTHTVNTITVSGGNIIIGAVIPFLILTIVFIIITFLKGEKPRWQWGNKNDNL